MIEGLVKKIMYKGLNKYAKIYENPITAMQIKVSDNPASAVFYDICLNFNAVERVKFLQIMDSRLDLLGYESMSNPIMKSSLEAVALQCDVDVEKISCFIHEHNQDIWLAFYNEFINVKTIRLSEHLAGIGMGF